MGKITKYERQDCPYIDRDGTWPKFKRLFPQVKIIASVPEPDYFVVADLVAGSKVLLRFADAWRMECFVKGALYAAKMLKEIKP